MKSVRLAAAVFFCASSIAVAPATRANSGIPEAVTRAAAFNAAAMNGVLVEERHVEFSASAGPAHFSQQNDAVLMLQDGEYKRLRYLRIVENGRVLPSDKVSQKESETNADLEHGKTFFKQPFDSRYLRDYTFSDAPCGGCNTHERNIEFASTIHDDQHGNGTMTIDASTGRVISVTYTPNVLPERANAATVTESFGEAVPGVWTIISIEHDFSGRVAFIHGSGKMIERMDHFQRFTDTYAGMQYLQRASSL